MKNEKLISIIERLMYTAEKNGRPTSLDGYASIHEVSTEQLKELVDKYRGVFYIVLNGRNGERFIGIASARQAKVLLEELTQGIDHG